MAWYATKKASKLPSMDKSKILVFDVETTGLSAVLDEIIQITIMDGYGRILFSSYIKPTRHKVWPIAYKTNGISYEMVKNAPTFKKVKKEIQEIFNNALLVVGYKVEFDIEFVEAEGVVVTGAQFDVMKAFASYRAGIERTFARKCSLVKCAEYFDYSFKPHDSEEDTRATLYCFNALISDERFTTFKRRKKKSEKVIENINNPEDTKETTDYSFSRSDKIIRKQVRDASKPNKGVWRKPQFSIEINGGLRQAVFLGMTMMVVGIFMLIKISNIMPKDADSIMQMIDYIKNNIMSNRYVMGFTIVAFVGMFMVLIRLLRMIVLFPKRLIIGIQKLFKILFL